MSFNKLILQTISCFQEVLQFVEKVKDEKVDSYLSSVVTNLMEEWRQHVETGHEVRHMRQMSDHVVCSKKSYENTLERLRRNSQLDPKPVRKSEDLSNFHLTIPSENAPSLPPRNNLTRYNVLRERKSPKRHNLLKSSNSAADLELGRKPSPVTDTPENKSLHSSYDVALARCQTPEIICRSDSPVVHSPSSLENSLDFDFITPSDIKPAKSCSDLLDKANDDSIGDLTLLAKSLRSSYVKFKPKNGKWSKMYLTLIGKNIYVSRNYADDQTENVYSLEEYEIVPKDEGKSKFLIFLKSGDVTHCSISMKSYDIRNDWYKSMVRAKFRPHTKSSSSLDISPMEGDKQQKNREGIYVSANTVNPTAARDMGIKVLINDKYDTLERKKVSKENGTEPDVINDWNEVDDKSGQEETYLSLLTSPVNSNPQSCNLADGHTKQVCGESVHFYLQH